MNKRIFLLFTLMLLIVISCTKKEGKPADSSKSIVLLKEIARTTETFDGDSIAKEYIEYFYERDDDYFWIKAIYKDTEGNVLKTIERQLDEARLPKLESVKEFDILTQSIETKYDPAALMLLEKTVYDGEPMPENKTLQVVYKYSDGILISEQNIRFSTDDDFINCDGNNLISTQAYRVIPGIASRPKGYFPTYFYPDKSIFYAIEETPASKGVAAVKEGDVEFREETQYSDEGFPVHHKTSMPDCDAEAYEEWFSVEKDGLGNATALTGFANEDKDSLTETNTKYAFEYDSNGYVTSIKELKYNKKANAFDRFHDGKRLAWIDPKIEGGNFTDASTAEEHFCLHSQSYAIKESNIVKYDSTEKIIEIRQGGYDGIYRPEGCKTDLKERITIKLKKIVKKIGIGNKL